MTLSQEKTRLLKKAPLFTLLEIVVAIAVLSIGISTIFYFAGNSNRKLMTAEKRWGSQHMLNNACEYFLLCGHEASLPADLFPQGFYARCEFEIYEDIPTEIATDHAPLFAFEGDYKGWHLALYTIKLYSPESGSEPLAIQKIEKIVRDEDL